MSGKPAFPIVSKEIRVCKLHQKKFKLEGTFDNNPNPPICQIKAIDCSHPGVIIVKTKEPAPGQLKSFDEDS